MYVVQSRAGGKSRRAAVGRHGEVALNRARKEATRLIARTKPGQPLADAAPEAPPTVADLAGRYLREHGSNSAELGIRHIEIFEGNRLQ